MHEDRREIFYQEMHTIKHKIPLSLNCVKINKHIFRNYGLGSFVLKRKLKLILVCLHGLSQSMDFACCDKSDNVSRLCSCSF